MFFPVLVDNYIWWLGCIPIVFLVGGLEHDFYFPYIGNVIIPTDDSSYFSEGVGQPPTRFPWFLNVELVGNPTTPRGPHTPQDSPWLPAAATGRWTVPLDLCLTQRGGPGHALDVGLSLRMDSPKKKANFLGINHDKPW